MTYALACAACAGSALLLERVESLLATDADIPEDVFLAMAYAGRAEARAVRMAGLSRTEHGRRHLRMRGSDAEIVRICREGTRGAIGGDA